MDDSFKLLETYGLDVKELHEKDLKQNVLFIALEIEDKENRFSMLQTLLAKGVDAAYSDTIG